MKTIPLPSESLRKVRDVFVFQTYTCLSYTDLKDFDATKIQEVKNMKVYMGKRAKTDQPFTIPLLPPALAILKKYKTELPIISNVKYNEYLKVVAQAAGIDKPVSSHWARHTGATLLLNGGTDMRIVSKICGHSSTRITEQVYAKLLDETVVDAMATYQRGLRWQSPKNGTERAVGEVRVDSIDGTIVFTVKGDVGLWVRNLYATVVVSDFPLA